MQTTLFSLGLTGMLVLGAGVAPVWAAAPAPVPSGVPAPATGGGWAVVAERLRAGAQETAWRHLPRQEAPTAAQLGQAVDLNRGFWLARLRKDGFFEPVTELRRRRGAEEAAAPDERCQAAALWTLAGLCRARPTPEARQALMLGLDALARQTREFPVRASAPALPGTAEIHTITVAHLALTLLEMTAGQERDLTPDGLRQMELWLQSHLAWLQAMENSEGGWAVKYVLLDQSRDTTADPATDGACFLAAVRAARWSGRADQLARLTDHGRLLARRYTGDGWREVRDPAATRAFLALGSLAYRELAQAGGPDADTFRAVAVGAAWWLALDQGAAQRERALAQTTLVLLTGAQAAREAGDPAAGAALAALAAPPLRRLAAWQVRGPLAAENPYLQRLAQPPPRTEGGFMTGEDSGVIRAGDQLFPVRCVLAALPPAAAPVSPAAAQAEKPR